MEAGCNPMLSVLETIVKYVRKPAVQDSTAQSTTKQAIPTGVRARRQGRPMPLRVGYRKQWTWEGQYG